MVKLAWRTLRSVMNVSSDCIMQLVARYSNRCDSATGVSDRAVMSENHRSGCPINLTLEVLGDRWSLLVIRDIMFGNRRHFRELLTQSEEGIASNILADRLKRLTESGFLTRADDESHKQKAI